MDSPRHHAQMDLLLESLGWELRDRQDVFLGGNMFVYFSETQVKKNDFRGPDLFVVLDTVRRERKSWVVWQEERTPDVVIELLSESTAHVDRGEKKRIYERALRVGDYILFDPDTAALEAYTLKAGAYRRTRVNRHGRLPVSLLGLEVGLWGGTWREMVGPWLRWYHPDGSLVLTEAEAHAQRAEAEAQRAEAEAQRAEAEAQRAEAEAQRADDLAARLELYERRFGRLE